jgi:DNA-binding CsgD family transcriptional regulator
MGKKATAVVLSEKESKQLLSLSRAGKTQRRLAERASIILAAAEGKTTAEIAAAMNTRPARVSK